MQFFWVNLGTTHKEAREGKFLWAPLSSRSKTGKKQTRRHWDNVGEVKTGDLIFCYHDNYLRAIAKAERDAYPADRPPTRSFNEWSNEGFRVDIAITDLKRHVRSGDIAPTYRAQFNVRTEPTLINSKGRITQIYMAHVPADAALYLLEQAEVIADYEDLLIDAGSPGISREAGELGRINIQDGTKGGRPGASAPRWIAVDDHVRGALGFARQVSPAGSRNLIAPHESYLSFLQEIIRPARDILHAQNLKGFHELRAAYACERFEQVTHHRAPINGGQCCQVDRNLDREARRQISYELGQGRIDVVAAYVGGCR